MYANPAIHVALLGVAAATTAGLAAYALRNRQVQAAGPFAGLTLAFTLYSAAHLVGLLTLEPQSRLVWEQVQWVGTAALPLCWLAFALEYTGHDRLLEPRILAALAAVPVATVLLAWTNAWHGLMWTHNAVVVRDGLAIMDQAFGPWFWVYTVYTYGAVVAGSVLLLRLIWRSDRLYADQSLLLVVGVAVPLVASLLTVAGRTPIREPALDMTPYAFAVTGVAFGEALFRRRLFELVPATRRLGRDAAIAQLDDGIVIVDAARQVVYCNPAAGGVLDCDPADALGRPVDALVAEDDLAFDAEDALATVERDGRRYEIRPSPITDRRDRHVGHTLVIHDVTARERRERRLARQAEQLERLDQLNAVIRGVNGALVSATTREEVERAVCDRLAASALYRTVRAGDVATWRGEADCWTVAGGTADEPALPATLREAALEPGDGDGEGSAVVTAAPDDRPGSWTVAPLAYGRTVYGAVALYTDRPSVSERERAVLAELGELAGHAITAVEHRRLLAAEAVVELTFAATGDDSALVAAATGAGCRLDVSGLVPGANGDHVAYLRVEDGPAERAAEQLAAAGAGTVRTVRAGEDGGLLEWRCTGDALLGVLADHGANLQTAAAAEGAGRFTVEVASDADGRSLRDHVTGTFSGVSLEAKRELDRPVERAEEVPADAVRALTDRQREALEAAYRAGYFDWPRESTAEEVAESLDIAGPTLHGHLRKAEARLVSALLDRE